MRPSRWWPRLWHGAGRGCEICLNADAVQAHAETYIGLVECGVGLIPGWGGCGEMIRAAKPQGAQGADAAVAKAFETISTATVAKSAANAKEIGYLRPATASP
jgi:3-hydroxyacyl-CoA dehydrogenase